MLRTQFALAPNNSVRSVGGFSTIEVLASLVVTALLLLSLTPFVGQSLATWSRGSSTSRLVELTSRGLGQLRADLRRSIVWTGYGNMDDLLSFKGSETSMTFPVAGVLEPNHNAVEMVLISVDISVDGRALVRRQAPVVGSTFVAFRDPVVLFSGPYKFFFRYYARDNKELSVWKGRSDLPARVELQITNNDGASLLSPVGFEVLASISAGCLANPHFSGCPNEGSSEATLGGLNTEQEAR